MGTTTFSGPVKAGPIREGATANVGTLVCAQSAAVLEISTEADTGIIIPANSQIINMYVLVQTAWDGGTNTLDVGISGNTDLYVDGLDTSTAGNHRATAAATGTEANWRDIGTSDVTIYIQSVATGNGAGVLTVEYIQNRNLT
jgi:hypothetical protein|tara:strand:- start:204 stop:632 length:429 start_codon:yes stop_codon:yes gene_type:complete